MAGKDVTRTLASEAYRHALAKAREYRKRILAANRFTLGREIEECDAFYSMLKAESPEIFALLSLLRKETLEAAFEKRAGFGAIFD